MENYTLYNKLFGLIDLKTLIGNIIIAAAIFIAARLAAVLVIKKSKFFTGTLLKSKTENSHKALHDSFVKPLSLWITVTGAFFAVRALPFAAELWITVWPVLVKVYRLSIIIIVCLALVNLITNLLVLSPKIAKTADKTAFSFISKLAKGIVIAIAVIAFLQELSFDVTGLIASLGIGGVVLALAAQDTASNFFSGVVILFDKPFAIGDWISVGGMEGIVEEMNFRSCRIRTFDNALISVPNSKLSGDSVTNWQKMELRKAKIVFGVTYSTKKETLQNMCDEIRANLAQYSDIKQDTVIVWFDSFNASSLDICVQYLTYLTSFKDFTLLKEKVQYMIMDVVEKHGSDFAFDTKTVIIENQ